MSWDAYNKKRKELKEKALKEARDALQESAEKSKKKTQSKAKNAVKKEVKKLNLGVALIALIFLAIGIGGGVFASIKICENDCFVLLGNKNIQVTVGDSFSFVDDGVKIVSFGRDISDKVEIKTNLEKDSNGNYIVDTSQEMEYYLIYTVEDIKFGEIQKVRVINISNPT